MTPDLDVLADQIIHAAEGASRYLVALAGPPGAGKSVRGQWLCDAINERRPGHAGLVPMDGYHFDNAVLGEQQVPVKGAPHTFDVEGLRCDLERIRQAIHPVAVPVFDRPLDLARAGGRVISLEQRIVLVEGNYLLLDRSPWRELRPLFDWTLFLEVDDAVLVERLVRRWLDMGQDHAGAVERTHHKDMLNAQLVKRCRLPPDQYWH